VGALLSLGGKRVNSLARSARPLPDTNLSGRDRFLKQGVAGTQRTDKEEEGERAPS
jgi:hypothetical protein